MGFAHSLGVPWRGWSNRFGRLSVGYAPRMPSPRDPSDAPVKSTPEMPLPDAREADNQIFEEGAEQAEIEASHERALEATTGAKRER
jgi:hypothetical protein